MKRAIFLISAMLCLILVGTIAFATADSGFDPDGIEIIYSGSPSVTADQRLEIALEFYIPWEKYQQLIVAAESVRVFGVLIKGEVSSEITENSGVGIDLEYVGESITDGEKRAMFRMNLGIISPEDYKNAVSARAFVSFNYKNSFYTVASDHDGGRVEVVPYDEALALYCDRSSEKLGKYEFDAGDGTYSPCQTLPQLRRMLSSYINVETEIDSATEITETDFYKSLFSFEYFDGILTISLPGSEIKDWLIVSLVVNGEERYYEIYEGKIKLVIEGQ